MATVKEKKVGSTLSKFRMKVRLTLVEELLGTKASDPDIHKTYIAGLNPDGAQKDEVKAAEATAEQLEDEGVEIKGMTIFHRDDAGNPVLWDYQIKGFFKDACGGLRRAGASQSGALQAYKGVIDGAIFVYPRQIVLNIPEGGEIGICQRPLRSETAKGPRVALCSSETVPAGTTIDIEIEYYNKDFLPCILEWLDYGASRGLGQWRNSGKGRITYQILS